MARHPQRPLSRFAPGLRACTREIRRHRATGQHDGCGSGERQGESRPQAALATTTRQGRPRQEGRHEAQAAPHPRGDPEPTSPREDAPVPTPAPMCPGPQGRHVFSFSFHPPSPSFPWSRGKCRYCRLRGQTNIPLSPSMSLIKQNPQEKRRDGRQTKNRTPDRPQSWSPGSTATCGGVQQAGAHAHHQNPTKCPTKCH